MNSSSYITLDVIQEVMRHGLAYDFQFIQFNSSIKFVRAHNQSERPKNTQIYIYFRHEFEWFGRMSGLLLRSRTLMNSKLYVDHAQYRVC